MAENGQRDLVLAPNEHAFVQDNTKGNISVYSGPTKASLSQTDSPVVFDSETKKFRPVQLSEAITLNVTAPKGFYCVLKNPADKQPQSGGAASLSTDTLHIGQKVNIPGAVSFPLWPGQLAKVIKGHSLRSNQYLEVRVYDEEAARQNWKKAVLTAAGGEGEAVPTVKFDPSTLATGQTLIIKGTDVSFYIPPTGVEVVEDSSARTSDAVYVRSAVTLERLEYCILLDEDGNKRYVQGPEVVFPEPTERFIVDGSGNRKFRAYELNEQTGLYIKVIADYEDTVEVLSPDGGEETKTMAVKTYKTGDELFITGKDMPIYFPRPEHAIIKYGENEKHHAIAIPAGEARYVLNRETGNIRLEKGPAMFMPDPRKEIIVRRILSDYECGLYYPGNTEALEYNRGLRNLQGNKAANYVGQDEYETKTNALRGSMSMFGNSSLAEIAGVIGQAVGSATSKIADQMSRTTTYTPPRTITLDNKYDGAITVGIWTGYAVQVVNKAGKRRIEVGPKTIMLEYDECLEPMKLSTGRPKTSDKLYSTVYLRTINNRVGDVLSVETADMVRLSIDLKYLVHFSGDGDRWFNIDNYVQYLSHSLRSAISNEVRGYELQEFYDDATNILRRIVLGKADDQGKHKGRVYEENDMHVYDLEVLGVRIEDTRIAGSLLESRQTTISNSLHLAAQERNLEQVERLEEIARLIDNHKADTRKNADAIRLAAEERNRTSTMAEASFNSDLELEAAKAKKDVARVDSEAEAIRRESKHLDEVEAQFKAEAMLKDWLQRTEAEAKAVVEKGGVISAELTAALTALSQTGTLQSLAKHLAPLAIVQGKSLAGTLETLVAGTPLAGMLHNVNSLSVNGVHAEPSQE